MGRVRICRRAFSLIELVIVVVIIAIIAGIAVPRMSSASDNAGHRALIGSQNTLQKAIDIYTIEHEGTPPHAGAADDKAFYFRLLKATDQDGTINEASGIFGPYINGIPPNPINGLNTIRRGGALPGANTHGWRYDPVTTQILPDHTAGATGFRSGQVKSVERLTDDLINTLGG